METPAPRLRPLSSQEPTLEDALEEHHFTPPKPDFPTPAEADVRHGFIICVNYVHVLCNHVIHMYMYCTCVVQSWNCTCTRTFTCTCSKLGMFVLPFSVTWRRSWFDAPVRTPFWPTSLRGTWQPSASTKRRARATVASTACFSPCCCASATPWLRWVLDFLPARHHIDGAYRRHSHAGGQAAPSQLDHGSAEVHLEFSGSRADGAAREGRPTQEGDTLNNMHMHCISMYLSWGVMGMDDFQVDVFCVKLHTLYDR